MCKIQTMKHLSFIIFLCLTTTFVHSQSMMDKLKQKKDSIEKAAKDKANSILTPTNPPALTNEEVINGLKEALTIGTNSSSAIASKVDGYYKNPRIFIPRKG